MKRSLFVESLLVVSSLLLAGDALAADTRSKPAERKSVSLTIYNENLGLVREVRATTLATGVQNLWFEGVTALIDPTSVHIRSVDSPDAITVLEQNFEYDLISPDRLMEKYLGQEVELVMTRGEREETVKARLIGTQGGTVYELADGKIAVNPPGRVILPALPSGLISKPSLVWLVDSKKAKQTLEASYLTAGMGWKADYVAVLAADDSKLDLSGWVTINNHSGSGFENASLKLVAGDVNRVRPEMDRMVTLGAVEMKAGRAANQFQEESFFEYHLYTLERPATVKDNQTKQIALLSAEDVKAKKSFVVEPQNNWWFSRMDGMEKQKVGVKIAVDNTKANGMGMPLPKGTVRVYKKDSKGALQFVGEDSIDHTPEDETVRVKMGEAFDVVAERVQTNFEVLSSGHLYRSSYKVTLRNHKSEAITVSVVELLSGEWKITQSSHPHDKEASHRVRFDVPVAAKGSTDLTYTAEIRY